jgi:hypothetical protein
MSRNSAACRGIWLFDTKVCDQDLSPWAAAFDAHTPAMSSGESTSMPRLNTMEAEPPELLPNRRPASSSTKMFLHYTNCKCDASQSHALNGIDAPNTDSDDEQSSRLFRLPLSGLCYCQHESIIIDHRVSAYCMHIPTARRGGVSGKRAVTGVCWPLLCCKLQNPATQTGGITADLASWVSRWCRHWYLIYFISGRSS